MKNWGKREGIKEAGLEEQQPARIKGIKEARWRLYGCARIKGIAWIDIGNRPAIINSPRVAWLPLMCSELLPQSILAECSPIDRRRLAAPPLPMPSLARRPSGWLPARFTISRRGDPTGQIRGAVTMRANPTQLRPPRVGLALFFFFWHLPSPW